VCLYKCLYIVVMANNVFIWCARNVLTIICASFLPLTIGDELTNQAVTTLSPSVMILYSWGYPFRQVLEYTHTLFSKLNSVNCLNPTKRIKMTVSLSKSCENIYYLQYLLSICFNSSLKHSYIRYIYLMFFISAVEFWYDRSK